MEISLFLLVFSFLILLLLGMPISWGLLVSCFLYLFSKGNILPAVLPQRMIVMLDSFTLVAIPFFIYAAEIMNNGKITDKIFDFANQFVGNLKGGLGYVNIIASVIFAGMSGSALADIMGLGRIEIKSMLDAGYDRKFAAAITAASAVIGPIIPPSIPLIIFGFLAEVSIARLLVGGLIPGLLLAAYQMTVVFYLSHRRNYPVTGGKFEWKKVAISFKGSWMALITPIIVLGGISIGVVTPTEAAVTASIYATVIAIFGYRSMNSANEFLLAFKNTSLATSRILLICALAAPFAWILTWERVPYRIIEFITRADFSAVQFLLLFNLLVLFLGCFLQGSAIIIMITPIAMPIVYALEIDPVHFGVMFVLCVMLGILTPPFGTGLFAVSSIAKIDIYELSVELIPFVLMSILALVTITFFPNIVLFLPNLIFG